jgi:hypothetical protein
MARKGPVCTDTTTIALGLAQIRVLASAANIGSINAQGSASDSIGSLANTKFIGGAEYFNLEGGFPMIPEFTTAIRESASLECSWRELTPFNVAMSYGIDPTSDYTLAHSGEVVLGGRVAPAYVRMEALYTYPDGTNTMNIIFPRAQVKSSLEIDFQSEDAAAVPVTFESMNASSDVSDGHAVWDEKPLGRIYWEDA